MVGPVRTIASATVCGAAAIMPVFLVGASGLFLREDLGFDESGLGVAIAVFMASSAVFGVAGGRISERIGAGNALMAAAIGSALVMFGVAVLSRSLTHISLLLALGGLSNSLAVPAGSLAIARGVAVRPALMFGVRQAAIPLATLLAGASVPLVSLTVGWRWAFALGAVLSLGAAVFVPRRLAPGRTKTSAHLREGDAATGPMVAMAVAQGVATATAVSLGAFLVEAAVAAGVAPGRAGWLLVAGSLAGICARLLVGWLADRTRGRALYMVSSMLFLGAGGYGLLSLGGSIPLTIGTLLAYGCGWGWPGLMMFATVRLNPNAPAAAAGILATGGGSGATLGPLAFGYVVTASSFQMAWRATAGAALLAGGLVLAARAWLRRDWARRETAA